MKKETLLEKELKKFNSINNYKYYIKEDAQQMNPDGLPLETAPDTTDQNVIDTDNPQPENNAPTNAPKEVNVSDIVNKVDNVEDKIEGQDSNLDRLFDTISKLEAKLGDMDSILSKIEGLESKMEKQMPKTDTQKLELRSLDSYPYNVKLDDFWNKNIEGYEVTGKDNTTISNEDLEDYPEEYKKSELILTQDDVDDYDGDEVKKSFGVELEGEDSDPYKFEKRVAFKTGNRTKNW